MLGGLLKSGWQSNSPEKRRLSILKMNTGAEANQAIFENLALNDPSLLVRGACITRLRLPAALFRAYNGQLDDAVKQTAKIAFCQLVGIDSKLSEAELEALLSEHSEAITLIAQHCPYSSLRSRLLDQLSPIEQAEAIAGVTYAETRFHVAEQLQQLEALEIARRELKGKDKKSEKLIRSKLEHHRSEQKLKDAVEQAAQVLCEKMQFIAQHPEWRSEFKGKYELYLQRWCELEPSPNDAISSQFESATQSAQLKVNDQIQHEDAEQSQVQICDNLEHYCRALAPLNLVELADERLSINAVLGEALTIWLTNSELVSPNALLAEKFLKAQKALSSLSDLIQSTSQLEVDLPRLKIALSALKWHKKYSDLAALAEASSLYEGLALAGKKHAKHHKDNLDSLHKRINRLLGTSNKGDVKKAKQELAATGKTATSYTGQERKALDERLQMASEIVSKMNDWQNFAIEPKLIQLCLSMEKLVNSKTHPDKLSQQISELQSGWKKLGHTDMSDQHWQRFNAAADLAYTPCASFFEQRRATQKDNLARREPLIAQMKSILDQTDWDASPDYKKVELRLRDITNEWRKINNVERKAGQNQWDRLSAIRDQVYQQLDIVYEQNIEQKNQLISQVNKLSEGVIQDNAGDKLKLLQSRWQQIGITRRKQDQQAWQLFRQAGDNLFEKVKASRRQKRALEDQQVQAYKSVVNDIHSLAKTATDLADADKQFELLSLAYAELPKLPSSLPEKLLERLESDFLRAGEAYYKAHDRIIQSSHDRIIDKLGDKADLCSQLELAFINADTSLINDLEAKIASIEINDKVLDKQFSIRLSAASTLDKSEANRSRTLLCIYLEILLDIASPAQDKTLRMQIQLERMKNTGLGHTTIEQGKVLAKAQIDWLCLAGADPELQVTLDQRFRALMNFSTN